MKEIIYKIEAMKTKEDFIEFINMVVEDLKNNPNEWENNSLQSYLEAMASWTEDMDGYIKIKDYLYPKM